MKSNKGLSMIELVVASMLFGILTLGFASFMKFSFKSQAVLSEQMDQIASDALGYRLIHNDLMQAGPSFEVMTKSVGGVNFFEYNPESTCTDCSRTVILRATPEGDEAQSIDFLIEELKASAGFSPLNPLSFYDPMVPNEISGNININRNTLKNVLSNLRSDTDLSEHGRLLLFYTPGRYGGGRMPSLVARVKVEGGTWSLVVPPELGIQRHPGSGLELTGASADDIFFRNMPPVGGNGQFALVKPLKLVRYMMVSDQIKERGTAKLIRVLYDGKRGTFPDCTKKESGCLAVVEQLKAIEFSRKDTASSLVKYHFNFERFEFEKERS